MLYANWSQSFRSFLAEAEYRNGDPLLVAVSGGVDSLALLHRMHLVVDPGALHVAHLDHGLRDESAGDARSVGELARVMGLSYHTRRVNVRALASEMGWSLEEAAREARYAFLAATARAVGASVVAAGHHAGDQAETVLLHLLRGSGLRGLRGMRPIATLPGAPELILLRPLLYQTREEITAYCHDHELLPLIDETNDDITYLRNRIRHQLLPQLESYNPQIVDQLNRMADIVTAEDELIAGMLDEIWPNLLVEAGPSWIILGRDTWRSVPLAIQRRALRRALETLAPDIGDISFRTLEGAIHLSNREMAGLQTTLTGGITLIADYDSLILSTKGADLPGTVPQVKGQEPLPFDIPGKVELANGWVLTAQESEMGVQQISRNRDPWRAFLALMPGATLFVRSRMVGERMHPLGMKGQSASLQDIMVNRKIAARWRQHWPLVVNDEHIVWLVGHAIDDRVRVSEPSDLVVELVCERSRG